MPRYEFMCGKCGKRFEVILTATERDAGNVACPGCGSRAVTPQMTMFSARTSRKS